MTTFYDLKRSMTVQRLAGTLLSAIRRRDVDTSVTFDNMPEDFQILVSDLPIFSNPRIKEAKIHDNYRIACRLRYRRAQLSLQSLLTPSRVILTLPAEVGPFEYFSPYETAHNKQRKKAETSR